MEYKNIGSQILIRLDDGEDILLSLIVICKAENVKGATISGIGAARTAEIAYWDKRKNGYVIKKMTGWLEIVSLSGNLAMLDEEIKPHLHIVISLQDYSCVGGHLIRAEVYPTCEIVLTPLDAKIVRKFDKKTGLNLQHFQ